MSSKGKKGLYELIGIFLSWLKARNYAPGTIRYTAAYVKEFAHYLEERGLYEIRNVTGEDLEKYLHWLGHDYQPRMKKCGERLAEFTVCSRWAGIFLFFRFIAARGYTLYNPALSVERPRGRPKSVRLPLTISGMESLLRQPDTKTRTGLRNRAILEMFYGTGMRCSELLGLEIFDVDLTERTVRIRSGKGGKERLVPLGEAAAFYLERYLRESRPYLGRKNPRESALFLNQYGGRLEGGVVRLFMRSYSERAGFIEKGKRVTPHVLRHSCASHLLEGGADIFSVKELLGHERLATTQIYTTPPKEKLKDVHSKRHPRGGIP